MGIGFYLLLEPEELTRKVSDRYNSVIVFFTNTDTDMYKMTSLLNI